MLEWICDLFLGIGSIFSGLELKLGTFVHLKIVKGKGDHSEVRDNFAQTVIMLIGSLRIENCQKYGVFSHIRKLGGTIY